MESHPPPANFPHSSSSPNLVQMSRMASVWKGCIRGRLESIMTLVADLLLLNEGRSTFNLERGFVIMEAALIKTIIAIPPKDSVPQYAIIFLLLQGTGPLSSFQGSHLQTGERTHPVCTRRLSKGHTVIVRKSVCSNPMSAVCQGDLYISCPLLY